MENNENKEISWKTLGHGPHVGVIGFAVDASGRFPVMKRSDKVKSIPNVWSLPSGTHETGSTFIEVFEKECEEELNIRVNNCKVVGVYENIATKEGWHWVMIIVVGATANPEKLKNTEPEKHSEIDMLSFYEFLQKKHTDPSYSPAMMNAAHQYSDAIAAAISEVSYQPTGGLYPSA